MSMAADAIDVTIDETVVARAAGYVSRENALMRKGLKAHAAHQASLLRELATMSGVSEDDLRLVAIHAIANSS